MGRRNPATALAWMALGAWGALGAAPVAALPQPGDLIDVSAFLQNMQLTPLMRGRAADDDPVGGPRLLGVQAAVPLAGARTAVEYSMVAPDTAASSQSARDHSLFRVRLDKQWRDAAAGVRWFSVGSAFAGESTGGQRLRELGLSARGSGAEAWASWSVSGLTLRPAFRQVTLSRGRGEETRDRLSLAAERRLPFGSRLGYEFEAIVSERDGAGAGDRDQVWASTRHGVRLQQAGWHVALDHQAVDAEGCRAAGVCRDDQVGLSARLRIAERLTLQPALSRRAWETAPGYQQVRDRSTVNLSYATPWPQVPRLDLRLGYEDTVEAGASRRASQIALSFKSHLGFGRLPPRRTSLGVSLHYRDQVGVPGTPEDEGLGIRLRFEHHPGR